MTLEFREPVIGICVKYIITKGIRKINNFFVKKLYDRSLAHEVKYEKALGLVASAYQSPYYTA